jgi:hypothetical protein
MREEIAERWIEALESGDYAQGKLALHVRARDANGNPVDKFCCLGVLCDLASQDGVVRTDTIHTGKVENIVYDGKRGEIPESVKNWAGVRWADLHVPARFLVGMELDHNIVDTLAMGASVKVSTLNDSGKSFKEIAAIIRRMLETEGDSNAE